MAKQRTRLGATNRLDPLPNGNAVPTFATLPAAFAAAPLLKLDFGCGPNPREGGYDGVDQFPFDGKVKHVINVVEPIYAPLSPGYEWMVDSVQRKVIGYKPWPWPDNSVEAAHTSHFIEHLNATERVHFVNELWRVLVPGGKCDFIVPHWASCRAYGDPTHQWPPVSEFWFYYLSREWRKGNAPHTDAVMWKDGFSCDFEAVWGYSLHPALLVRNQEFQQEAIQWKKEAIQDVQGQLTARK